MQHRPNLQRDFLQEQRASCGLNAESTIREKSSAGSTVHFEKDSERAVLKCGRAHKNHVGRISFLSLSNDDSHLYQNQLKPVYTVLIQIFDHVLAKLRAG